MTPAFLTTLRIEDDQGFPFTLIAPLVYDSALTPRPITVPTCFQTDFASIPRVLWNVLPPVGKYDRAAVIHDYCYAKAPLDMDRARADAILLESMKVCGVSKIQRAIIYAGVRIGGFVPWKKYRAQQAEIAA